MFNPKSLVSPGSEMNHDDHASCRSFLGFGRRVKDTWLGIGDIAMIRIGPPPWVRFLSQRTRSVMDCGESAAATIVFGSDHVANMA